MMNGRKSFNMPESRNGSYRQNCRVICWIIPSDLADHCHFPFLSH